MRWEVVAYLPSEENIFAWIPYIVKVPKDFQNPSNEKIEKYPIFDPFSKKFNKQKFKRGLVSASKPSEETKPAQKENKKVKEEKNPKTKKPEKSKSKLLKKKKIEKTETETSSSIVSTSTTTDTSSETISTPLFKSCDEGIARYQKDGGKDNNLRIALEEQCGIHLGGKINKYVPLLGSINKRFGGLFGAIVGGDEKN